MGDLAGVALFGGQSSGPLLLDKSSWALTGLTPRLYPDNSLSPVPCDRITSPAAKETAPQPNLSREFWGNTKKASNPLIQSFHDHLAFSASFALDYSLLITATTAAGTRGGSAAEVPAVGVGSSDWLGPRFICLLWRAPLKRAQDCERRACQWSSRARSERISAANARR